MNNENILEEYNAVKNNVDLSDFSIGGKITKKLVMLQVLRFLLN
jgi:hypothetical protein|tara:strand:+ start:8689 stop:8820 length:132 start_codon:yes stop_codon:yes gene_type:complete